MLKETKRKLAGVGILIFGAVVFVLGELFVKNFVSLFEAITSNENIQIILMVLFFDIVFILPLTWIYLYFSKEEKPVKD
jgi:hypothetical protein